jgi:hypothetical protein
MMRKLLIATWLFTLVPLATIKAEEPTAATATATAAAPDDEPQSVVTSINSPGSHISVTAPEELLRRAEKVDNGDTASESDEAGDSESEATQPKKPVKTGGYRVQVYADNNVRNAKIEARQRERAVAQAFPNYATYVSYVSPYWRLRVGDFRSQYEAEKAAAEIRQSFPRYSREVRVVRDRINAR